MIWKAPSSISMTPAKYTQPTQPVSVGSVIGPVPVLAAPVTGPAPPGTASPTGPVVTRGSPPAGLPSACCGPALEPAGVLSPSLMTSLQVVLRSAPAGAYGTRAGGHLHA